MIRKSAMIMKADQLNDLDAKVRPLIKWLNDNCHPHNQIIITPTGAQLLEGVYGTGEIIDYLKD